MTEVNQMLQNVTCKLVVDLNIFVKSENKCNLQPSLPYQNLHKNKIILANFLKLRCRSQLTRWWLQLAFLSDLMRSIQMNIKFGNVYRITWSQIFPADSPVTFHKCWDLDFHFFNVFKNFVYSVNPTDQNHFQNGKK